MQVSGAAPTPVVSGIMHLLMKIDEKMNSQSLELSELRRESQQLRRDIQYMEFFRPLIGDSPDSSGSAAAVRSHHRDEPHCAFMIQSAYEWVFPVCKQDFKHRESFKGHIRGLLQHVRCVWSAEDASHVSLVSKFQGDDFYSKAASCSAAMYAEVCACTSSMDSEAQSHAHIFDWISAAQSSNMDVVLPRFNTGNRRERKRRSRSVTSHDATCDSSQARSSSRGRSSQESKSSSSRSS
jgi:hypothetical protein